MGIPTAAEVEAWGGDPEKLEGAEELLAKDAVLCDYTFTSKQEAFTSGLYLGAARSDSSRDTRSETPTRAILAITDETPWGDIELALRVIDEALTVAMDATTQALRYWD